MMPTQTLRKCKADMRKKANLVVFLDPADDAPHNRMRDEPENEQTRQGETPEVQSHGVALPP